MKRHELTDGEIKKHLVALGEGWRQSLAQPVDAALDERFAAAVQRARMIAEQARKPSVIEEIAAALRIQVKELLGFGTLSLPWAGGLSPAGALSFDSAEEKMTQAETASSLDGLIQARFEVASDGKATVSFKTSSPTLASATVQYCLLSPSRDEPDIAGSLVLEPIDTGWWGGWDEIGTARELGLSAEHRLVFGIQSGE